LPKEKNYVAHFLLNLVLKNKIKTKKNKKDDKKNNPNQPELYIMLNLHLRSWGRYKLIKSKLKKKMILNSQQVQYK